MSLLTSKIRYNLSIGDSKTGSLNESSALGFLISRSVNLLDLMFIFEWQTWISNGENGG